MRDHRRPASHPPEDNRNYVPNLIPSGGHFCNRQLQSQIADQLLISVIRERWDMYEEVLSRHWKFPSSAAAIKGASFSQRQIPWACSEFRLESILVKGNGYFLFKGWHWRELWLGIDGCSVWIWEYSEWISNSEVEEISKTAKDVGWTFPNGNHSSVGWVLVNWKWTNENLKLQSWILYFLFHNKIG